jgi:hypothetical protein
MENDSSSSDDDIDSVQYNRDFFAVASADADLGMFESYTIRYPKSIYRYLDVFEILRLML